MKIGSKTILKLTAFIVLAESIYALIAFHLFYPVQVCSAIVSLFTVNSAHEHIETYMKRTSVESEDSK